MRQMGWVRLVEKGSPRIGDHGQEPAWADSGAAGPQAEVLGGPVAARVITTVPFYRWGR